MKKFVGRKLKKDVEGDKPQIEKERRGLKLKCNIMTMIKLFIVSSVFFTLMINIHKICLSYQELKIEPYETQYYFNKYTY